MWKHLVTWVDAELVNLIIAVLLLLTISAAAPPTTTHQVQPAMRACTNRHTGHMSFNPCALLDTSRIDDLRHA